MDIDLDLLTYMIGKGKPYIDSAVEGTQYLPKTVTGVGTFLLDNYGDTDLLAPKPKATFEKFLQPLLFNVQCQGLTGPGSCVGNKVIDEEILLKCYRDAEFRCSACRKAIAAQGV